ncbi:probable amino acid transporters [Phialocephala subalpina]|uniref:Probable amino acid transporters n=1 Tax=Phialocephala subalpina TaxID=576137 RepID=A0A1L7WFG9_9HELO|nr:probable amino acid transporters [Phialocephala subalpina]
MAKSTKGEDVGISRNSSSNSDGTTASNADAARLAEMGYVQDMKRNFSVFSLLGVGFSLTNSWFGISTALVTGINSGGPVLIVYGIILIAIISTCVGISLSELASAMPNAGGQYFWANELAPKGYGRFASYLTGWFAWAGSIFTTASVALGLGSAVMGCIQLFHPTLVIKPWQVLIAYEIINAFAFLFNCYGKLLPRVATFTLWCSLLSFTVILITVPSVAPTHETAKFVFANFVNNTGWSSNGIAFIVGLINTNWAFACLDCATHMAEEVLMPERNIPIAIMGTVAIGFVTSWFYSVAMFFSINNLELLFNTPTGVPILALFHQALRSRGGALVLELLILSTGLGCQIASQTWQSRLCWSFARDNGLPFSPYLAKIHPKLDVPFNAHLFSSIIVAVLGLLYLGSITAFNSMVTACIVLLYISYSIPVACLLMKGRENIRHGPFWLGKVGAVANWVLLLWTAFTLVMYSFPPVQPVKAGNMNYVCVVYAVVTVILTGWWFGAGRWEYRGVEERKVDVVVAESDVVS